MESQLSLGDVTKSVFTPDFSSTYKSASAGSTLCNMLTTNTIKQSISVDSSNKSEIKESEYKIKEAEKIISKNILFSIYEFNINSKYSTYSSYLGQNVHTYEYTNLSNPEVPSFKKLHLYLDQIEIILNNHKGIVASKDTGNQLYNSLQEFITEIKSSTDNIYSIVMGNKIIGVESDNFIINAEKLFKGETAFKSKKFTGDKSSIASYFNSVKNKYLDIAASVAGYNDGLQKALIKFNKVMGELATEYKSSYSQVALQIEYKKEELRNVLYSFAMKYFNIANILYSIKAECIHEYLYPSYSEYDNILTIKEDNSLEEYDDGLFDESADIFDDTDISGDDREINFSYKTIDLEEAFFAYTIKPLLEGEEDGKVKGRDSEGREILAQLNKLKQPKKKDPPAPAPTVSVEKDKDEQLPTGTVKQPAETDKKVDGTVKQPAETVKKVDGTVKQPAETDKKVDGTKDNPADADKKVDGTKDNPADADKESHIEKGGDVTGFASWLKELWNKITGFMKDLMDKISFAVSKSRDRLLDIIDDFDSVKKINENLNNSDDEYTFRVYNKDLAKTSKRINGTKIMQMSELMPINTPKDLANIKNVTTQIASKFKSGANKGLLEFCNVVTTVDLASSITGGDNSKLPDKEAYGIALKNYFAGYDAPDVKASYNDIKINTEGKAKNNILASNLTIAGIKQMGVNAIISNIKLARIDQLKNQYNNMNTNGTNYINKITSIAQQQATKAESAKVTMESVLSEYFSDIIKINEDTVAPQKDQNNQNELDEIKKSFNLIKTVCIDYYADPIFKNANFAYQQMCDNYYNIFNALLSNPLKNGQPANNTDNNQNQEAQPQQNGQAQAANQPQQTGTPAPDTKDANGEQPTADK